MSGRRKSALANDRRAFACYNRCPTFSVTYYGNENSSGSVPIDTLSYTEGTSVTVLGNTGSLARSGYTFTGWTMEANGSGTVYSSGNTFYISTHMSLYAKWTSSTPPPNPPTLLTSVAGNREAYILFTQVGTVTNYAYSTDGGATFKEFDPPQTFSPVNISLLSSSDDPIALTNETTYTVILKAMNAGGTSEESMSVEVTPTVTSLYEGNRLIRLEASDSASYSGSGTTWTNLDSGGSYSAELLNLGSETFGHDDNENDQSPLCFAFTGGTQGASIAQADAINPTVPFGAFTVQIWAKVDATTGSGLISKQYGGSSFDGYSLTLSNSSSLIFKMNGRRVDGTYSSSAGVYNSGWALYTIVVRFGGNFSGLNNPSYAYVSSRRVITGTNAEEGMETLTSANAPLQFPRGIQNGNFGQAKVGAFYFYNTALSQETIIQNFDATKHYYLG